MQIYILMSLLALFMFDFESTNESMYSGQCAIVRMSNVQLGYIMSNVSQLTWIQYLCTAEKEQDESDCEWFRLT